MKYGIYIFLFFSSLFSVTSENTTALA